MNSPGFSQQERTDEKISPYLNDIAISSGFLFVLREAVADFVADCFIVAASLEVTFF